MRIDINRLLELDYLNNLELQLNDEINRIRESFLEQYDLDKLKEMNIENVTSLFGQYGVDNADVLQYLESDFIDSEWEFADLFLDDISYSTGLRDKALEKALKDVNELNNKISLINDGYQRNIDELEGNLVFIDFIIKLQSKNEDITKEDIDNLNSLIMNSELSDSDKFKFSYDVVKYLIEKNKRLFVKKTEVDTSEFEKKLDEVYVSSNYKEDTIEENIEEPDYSETILSSYKYYKELFNEVGLGITVSEIMNNAFELSSGVNASIDSMSKEDFCIELGALLYSLNEAQNKKKVDQDAVADILMDLSILDRLYEEDSKYTEYRKMLLEKIKEDLSVLSSLNIDNVFSNKIKNRLSLLQTELKNNLISTKRKEEIDAEYKNIQSDMSKISDITKQLSSLGELSAQIYKMSDKLKASSLKSNNLYAKTSYIGLSELRSRVLEFIEVVRKNGFNPNYNLQIEEFSKECLKYANLENVSENDKINLKGFVLFDFDENNKPYVVSDLDPNNNKSLIDEGVLQNKVNGGFEDYNSLIRDLLVYGNPEILRDEKTLPYMDRILTCVYYDKNKNSPSKMVRIRPLRNSLVRFVSQKIVLKTNTDMHKQVLDIIQEILPGVSISSEEDFPLYINFSSAIKQYDEDSYSESINRYKKKSPLYSLFIDHPGKTKLTEEECSLLRDIIHMTLDAYYELEKKNENLRFDIVRQIGGKKSRG